MDDKKNTKADTPKAETSPAVPQPATNQPVFSLERLRRDCFKVFGVTSSTFDGAAHGLDGDFTVDEIRKIINDWQSKPIFGKIKKEGK